MSINLYNLLKRITTFFLALAACISVLELHAQIHAEFSVDATKGCIPFTVNITDLSGSTSATPFYNYDYLGGTQGGFTTSKVHTYTTPGTYRIHQFITTDIPANSYDVDIVVVASPTPVITLKSCAGNIVDVTVDAVYDQYLIDFNDGSAKQTAAPGSTTSYMYGSEGMKSVTVTGSFNPNTTTCGSKTSTVYALTAVVKPDIIDLRMLKQHTSAGSIRLNFNALQGQNYRIEQCVTGGTFLPVSTFTAGASGIQTYTDINLNTQANDYQYRIVAFNDCGTEIPSDIIYSVGIDATPANMVNNIFWNNDGPVNSFDVYRNGVVLVHLPGASTGYPDNAVICGFSYTYQTTATYTTTTLSGVPHKSYSIDTTIIATSTVIPPTLTDVNSTMNGNTATISWTNAVGISSYNLYVSQNGGAYSLAAKPGSSPYSYSVPNTSDRYCFQLTYSDNCNNTSLPSNLTCPVTLQGVQTGSNIILSWTPYSGYNSGAVSYTVQKIDEAGNVLTEIPATGTTYTETVTLTEPYLNYRIKVTTANPAFTTGFSNNSLFKFEAQVFVPDIFTPNGDGVNDHFIVKSKYVSTYNITIYTRWGEVVYVSSDINAGWNGMNNTEYAQDGAYTYKIIGTDIHNNEFIHTGTLTLAR
ncbi:conserved hypothetical protein [Cytophaga hutchinsonii ATCC 33406]|uniref:Fibronectin type-III domain-containing protein n=1 Tax=Cytophaga hutchinsonii (strain ATCC 33406 / DSM 1761 / CIP 103989 / NBRC 15051 / NCIMB 9469 / D465) TaxID=269798 RepID=A0A6N4SUD4_CYTH3|nr:conserved hypothetical protein [Cytophaga hutchinsonii ATCC 33406]